MPAGGLSLIQVALQPASQTLVWPWITGNAVETEVRNQGSWGHLRLCISDKLTGNTDAAGLNNKGLETSVGRAGWSAGFVYWLVLSQASPFACALSSAYNALPLTFARKFLFTIAILAWAVSAP